MVPSHGHYARKTHFLGTLKKLGLTPLHTSIQIQFQWNGTHAISPYLDYSERERDNATLLTN